VLPAPTQFVETFTIVPISFYVLTIVNIIQ
jgi:hypothetical protein